VTGATRPIPDIRPYKVSRTVRHIIRSMTDLTATELDLLTFFEVLPKLRDEGDPWCYNDAAYEVRRGEFSLSFSVAPAYKDVRLILKRTEHTLYEFNAMDIEDLKYEKTRGGEVLEIVVTARDSLILRLDPDISISHSLRGRA
jgi:hypothetical protein